MNVGTGLLLATLVLAAQPPASLPAWLESYPGVTADVRSSGSLVESSYTTPAQTSAVIEHYRKLFEAASLPFQPNDDGIGTSVRAAGKECDLLLQIRTRSEGTSVHVNCSPKTESSSPSEVKVLRATAGPPQIPADWMAEHRRKAAEMGIHREYHDAPAPPLVWPSWLTNVNGAVLRSTAGVDYAKNATLTAHYITNLPMTEIYAFYRELLNSHEYPATSRLQTGHTQTGIQQNALGSIEGFNYPDGAPGAYSVLYVSFQRSVLNGPITVTLRFTTHEYIAKRGY